MTEDQRETWRKAIAASRRRQRRRRGRRATGIERADGPGMVRRAPRDGNGGHDDTSPAA